MSLRNASFVFVLALLAACSSIEGQRNDALRQVQGEQIALNNQVQSGLVQPGTPQYFNEVRRVRQRWVEQYPPVVDGAFLQHNTLLATLNDPQASASTRATASTELAQLRQKLYSLLQETCLFNQAVAQDSAQAQQVGYAWHLDYPRCPNTPAQVFTATAVNQIPGFQLAAAAPAQPQPVQIVPVGNGAPQGASPQQQGQQPEGQATPVQLLPVTPVAPQGGNPGQQQQNVTPAPQGNG